MRRRGDRTMGIAFFLVGLFATVTNMAAVTEDALVQQAVQAFDIYGLGEYSRPEGLTVLGWLGVILHPLNYAVWLLVALYRWRAKKFGAWCAIVGAVIALLLTMAIMLASFSAHPEIMDWAARGAPMPTN